jgi:glycosyltransferase involved in cell wall biosynthesis
VLTLAAPHQLAQARVLAGSLARHEPDCTHEILLIGRQPAMEAEADPPGPRSIADELDLDVELLVARYDTADLQRMLLPVALLSHVQRTGGPVLHLPPSAWVAGDLAPVRDALATHSVALAQRSRDNIPDDGLQPTPAQIEAAGRISDSVIAVDGSTTAEAFLAWWAHGVEKLLGSLDGRHAVALPEDRRWLVRMHELAPARFGTAVLDDPGFNLSMWNLHEHTLRATPEGVIVDRRAPLRMLDLPGFDPTTPYRIDAVASRIRVSRAPVLRELCATYAAALEDAGWATLDRRADVGRTLPTGLVYDETLRSLHGVAEGLGERFGDVFEEDGAQAFSRWLHAPAPVGGEHGIGRYLYYRIARERPDVLRAYPHLDGEDGPGCVGWCWVFGRTEMSIPDQFMPPRPASVSAVAPAAGLEDGSALRGPMVAPRGKAGAARDEGRAPVLAVRVSGYFGHALGLGAAARGYAQGLAAAGVPVSTATAPLHHLELPADLVADYGRHTFEEIVHDQGGSHTFELVAVNADELPGFVERLGEDYFKGPRIGIWGWETNIIPARWVRAFELVEEIWVYSRFMAENIGAVAPVPVIALPPPIQPPSDPVEVTRFDVPEDAFMFLFVFDYLSTIQRKNPVGLIEAFAKAFAPGEGPRLLVKTINAPLRPLAEEAVLWAADGRPDIHVVDRSLSASERDGLMAACDCYVSLHRSEGFGLTLAEAMAIGKPVVATGYSGNLDFMNNRNSFLVDHELTVVGPGCEIYPADGEWAQPSVEHAAQLMREVVADPEQAVAIGIQAREDIARLLSPRTTGAAMRKRLEWLAQGDAPPGHRSDRCLPDLLAQESPGQGQASE